MLKMTIDNEEVVSDKDITINEEMLSASSTILNNVYPKEWEEDKDYTSRFYYPQDYSKALIQRSYVTQEAEAGTTIQVNGSVTLTDVDTTKNSRVLRLLGQTSQTGTPTPSSPIPVNVVSGDNEILINGKNWFDKANTQWYKNNVSTFENTLDTSTTRIRTNSFRIQGGKTYTISGIPSGISLQTVRTYTIPSGESTNRVTVSGNTFTLQNDVNYIHLLFGGSNFTSDTNTLMANANIMINEGSSALPYEPYQGNTYNIDLPEGMELCKIGNYQDYIYKDSDKWYLHKEIGKYVYNNDLAENGIGSGRVDFLTPILDVGANISETTFQNMALSNCLLPLATNNTGLYGTTGTKKIRIRVSDSYGSTYEAIKTIFANNSLCIYYPLATSTNTEITYEPLLNQLNALSSQ